MILRFSDLTCCGKMLYCFQEQFRSRRRGMSRYPGVFAAGAAVLLCAGGMAAESAVKPKTVEPVPLIEAPRAPC